MSGLVRLALGIYYDAASHRHQIELKVVPDPAGDIQVTIRDYNQCCRSSPILLSPAMGDLDAELLKCSSAKLLH